MGSDMVNLPKAGDINPKWFKAIAFGILPFAYDITMMLKIGVQLNFMYLTQNTV